MPKTQYTDFMPREGLADTRNLYMVTAPSSRTHASMAEDRHPVVRLRPHHLLCLQNFRGSGYSPAFIKKMTEVSGLLGFSSASSKCSGVSSEKPDPGKPDSGVKKPLSDLCCILLTEGSDDLCECCPNCTEGQCCSEKPALFDRLILQASGYKYGQLLTGGLETAGFPLMSPELLVTCCPGCQWFSLCMEISHNPDHGRNGSGSART